MPERKRILFLEDQDVTRVGIGLALEQAGFDVVLASTVAEAAVTIDSAAWPFDVLVLNLLLDDGDGRDLCADLRKAGAKTPIIIHSGFDSLEYVKGAMRAGANDYLAKPYSYDDLIERINIMLELSPITHSLSVSQHGLKANTPSIRGYGYSRVESALRHLAQIAPSPGSLPQYDWGHDEASRPLPFDEKTANELKATINDVKQLLRGNSADPERIAEYTSSLILAVRRLSGWIGGRATLLTDETLKIFVKIGVPIYIAHAMGLKIDLMHLIVTLSNLASQ